MRGDFFRCPVQRGYRQERTQVAPENLRQFKIVFLKLSAFNKLSLQAGDPVPIKPFHGVLIQEGEQTLGHRVLLWCV